MLHANREAEQRKGKMEVGKEGRKEGKDVMILCFCGVLGSHPLKTKAEKRRRGG